MKRRILSLFFACVLLGSLLPARAAELPSPAAAGKHVLDGSGETYALSGNLSNGVEITGTNVKLDLGAYTVEPDVGSVIVVKTGASATVSGTGLVHAKGANAAALIVEPNATCTLEGGAFLADQYYTIRNYGRLFITGAGVKADNASSGGSSMVTNGWAGGTDSYAGAGTAATTDLVAVSYVIGASKTYADTDTVAYLNISGGTFQGKSLTGTGGTYTSKAVVKNDDYSYLVISGGTFDSSAKNQDTNAATILCWGKAKITGGTFVGAYPLSVGTAGANSANPGVMLVEGGVFRSVNQTNGYKINGYETDPNLNTTDTLLTITGGEFDGTVVVHPKASGAGASSVRYGVSVSGGVFKDVQAEALAAGKSIVTLNHLTYLKGVVDGTPVVTVTPAQTNKTHDGTGVTLTAALSPAKVTANGNDYTVACTYAWKRGSDAIGGATSNAYTTSPDVTAGAVTYTATATTNGVGYSGTATVTISNMPALTGTVTISGTAKVGQTLTATVSGSNNTGVLSYQWKANGTTISGATGNTFKLTAAEQGKTITCEVKSTVQTGSITSGATAAVAAADSSTTTAIWLNYTWLDLYVGDAGYLYATVTPSTDSVRWYSSDSSVVSVSSSGRYYANDWGSALITATAVGSGKSASCRIYVTDRYYNNDRRNTDKTIYEPITNPAAQKSGDSANKLPVETSVNTVAKTDGSKQTVINQPDGTSSVLITDGIGLVKSASVTYSSDAVNSASWSNGLLNFPGKVLPANNADSAPALRIVLPQSSQRVRVKVPVSYVTPGTVAVVENAFGPDQVLHSSTVQNDGVEFYLTGSSVVKIVDMTKDFYDISGNEWYAKSVDWASSHGVMNGVSEHAFDPNATMNRAMMTQIVYNYAGANADGVTGRFSDVNKNSWYGKSVTWAANNGIARASGDSFGAENDLTREDMVDMLYSYAKSKGYNTYQAGNTFAFADNADISDWARPAMSWAVGSGLIQGTQNGTRAVVLDPQGTATRAQLSAIMMRFNNMYEN